MKIKGFRQIARSVKYKLKELIVQPPDNDAGLKKLIADGNLVVGEDCLLDGLEIYNYEFQKNTPNVTIGNSCHIMGRIALNSPTAKITIGDRVFIGPDTTLFCRESISIEDDVMISWGCTIIDTNAHSLKSAERKDDVIDWKKGYQYKNWDVAKSAPVNIKAKAWIGFNSIITKGVTIGEGTVVGCGSVVAGSTKSYTVVGGNPAAFIKDTE